MDLFDETITLFDANPEQINILPTAKFKFQRDWEKLQKGRSRNPEARFINYEKTIELAEKLPQIADAKIDQSLFVQLSEFEGIDKGEAILTAYAAQILQETEPSQAFIFTGDKNYLRALAGVEIAIIQENFSHKFWCLEQLVLKAIDAYGFEAVRDKIAPVRECDKAIKAVFGSGEFSTLENSLTTLNSYIETLREETGSLLHPYPNEP
ncbi:hypothetical protein [Stenomitos frigidus]|uniref:hypothetical protein n=1 Tax=Stenomitos frigidus TaxID=1886765 RepID=UPI0011B24A58|nr:hypothetical protein [Stenomitos frigidus]